ncbi:hypothetical protein GMRT_12272 [Giardia muris]|uniref:Uncharacterized protein n=1 Tax=Giardia muris TaxID=5742 RepID=A0A4Z1SXT2_GIAMU|nr:hypothetical protein GMRT_12272 [Giardia muris]|eukprot:TNJ30572.1 hypothetical protein GMRT_12272 [Giardia muris]
MCTRSNSSEQEYRSLVMNMLASGVFDMGAKQDSSQAYPVAPCVELCLSSSGPYPSVPRIYEDVESTVVHTEQTAARLSFSQLDPPPLGTKGTISPQAVKVPSKQVEGEVDESVSIQHILTDLGIDRKNTSPEDYNELVTLLTALHRRDFPEINKTLALFPYNAALSQACAEPGSNPIRERLIELLRPSARHYTEERVPKPRTRTPEKNTKGKSRSPQKRRGRASQQSIKASGVKQSSVSLSALDEGENSRLEGMSPIPDRNITQATQDTVLTTLVEMEKLLVAAQERISQLEAELEQRPFPTVVVSTQTSMGPEMHSLAVQTDGIDTEDNGMETDFILACDRSIICEHCGWDMVSKGSSPVVIPPAWSPMRPPAQLLMEVIREEDLQKSALTGKGVAPQGPQMVTEYVLVHPNTGRLAGSTINMKLRDDPPTPNLETPQPPFLHSSSCDVGEEAPEVSKEDRDLSFDESQVGLVFLLSQQLQVTWPDSLQSTVLTAVLGDLRYLQTCREVPMLPESVSMFFDEMMAQGYIPILARPHDYAYFSLILFSIYAHHVLPSISCVANLLAPHLHELVRDLDDEYALSCLLCARLLTFLVGLERFLAGESLDWLVQASSDLLIEFRRQEHDIEHSCVAPVLLAAARTLRDKLIYSSRCTTAQHAQYERDTVNRIFDALVDRLRARIRGTSAGNGGSLSYESCVIMELIDEVQKLCS